MEQSRRDLPRNSDAWSGYEKQWNRKEVFCSAKEWRRIDKRRNGAEMN